MKVIDVSADDDIVSICDLLAWSDDHRVLLRMAEAPDVLGQGVSLARLRRHADRLRLDVGLVTSDRSLARKANGMGLPAFGSVEEAETSRRGWWRGRRRRELIGLPSVGRERFLAWREKEGESHAETSRPVVSRRQWLVRYVAILLFFVAISLATVWVVYALPRATITLRPITIEARALPQLVVDPSLGYVDYENRAIPGRLIELERSWSEEIGTSGSAIVPVSRARGRVILVNKTDKAVPVPRGTLLTTTDGSVMFQTADDLRMLGVISSTAEIDVVAVEAGPQGNVAAGSITRIADQLAANLDVQNPEAMSGGELRQVAAVAQEDGTRLRAQVLQFLQAVSWADMQGQLTEREFLPRESIRVIALENELFSHAVGEPADVLRLKIDARLQGTAVDLTQASGLVYEALSSGVPLGHTLVATSIDYRPVEAQTVDGSGRISLVLDGRGVMAADLEADGPISAVAGQEPAYALAYLLQALPLRETPELTVWPAWFKRVPYRAGRIHVEVEFGD